MALEVVDTGVVGVVILQANGKPTLRELGGKKAARAFLAQQTRR